MMTEELIKAALLGIDKYLPKYHLEGTDLPALIQEGDKEAVFLKQAASAFLYKEAGQQVGKQSFVGQAYVGEVEAFMEPSMAAHFNTALEEEDLVLLRFLLQHQKEQTKKFPPSLVPKALSLAKKRKQLAEDLVNVSGAIGQWLANLNEDWKNLVLTKPELDFETANHKDRIRYLKELRATDPVAAREILEQQITEETAEKRSELLATMSVGIEEVDIPFLEQLAKKDKSKKVKEAAQHLLLQIPSSDIAKQVYEYLEATIQITTSKKGAKLVFKSDIPLPETLLALNLSTISPQKKIPDHVHWIAQCLSLVSIDKVAEQHQLTTADFISLFQQATHTAYWNQYLSLGIVRHQLADAAITLFTYNQDWALFALLSETDRLQLYVQLLPDSVHQVIHDIIQQDFKEIDLSLATKIINTLRKKPYQINTPEYYLLGFYLPSTLKETLKKYSYADKEHQYFSKNTLELLRGMEWREKMMNEK